MEIIILIGGVLLVISIWQHVVDKAKKKETMAQLRESVERGTNKALAQYPQIKPYLCIGCGSCIQACPEDDVIGVVNGIAHIINGVRCIGHGRCETACPVGAITVGLGDITERPDIPMLTSDMESTVPGIYIAGELGGLALIRHAIDQGRDVIDAIANKRHSPPEPGVVDVLIVGAGPAGLSATLRAKEKKLTYKTISQDDIGGTIRKYPRRKLTLVQTVDIPLYGTIKSDEYSKEQLLELWEKLINKHGLHVETKNALRSVEKRGSYFHVTTDKGSISSRHVVLALGRRGTPRKLGVPGEELEKVLYQLIDASTYSGQKVLVVGGGDSAIEMATGLANQAKNQVIISYRKENFVRLKSRNEKRIQDYIQRKAITVLFSSQVERITAQHVSLLINRKSGQQRLELPNDFVFVAAGGEPPYTLLKNMGVRFGGENLKGAA